jgi:lambda family phage tail tape measure protein
MSIISRLSVVLGLDTAQFNAGLGKAEQDVNKFSSTTKAMGVAAVAALGTAFIAAAKDALEFADGIEELATANDMTIASTLELSQALAVSGGKLENTSKLLVTFTNKIDEAAQGSQKTRDKFKELGISLDDLRRLNKEELFEKTVKALAQMPDSTRKTALAFDLMGKSIAKVDLKAFAQNLDDVKGKYNESEESFKKIAAFGDTIAIAWFKAKVNIANTLVAISEAADKEMSRSLLRQKNYKSDLEAFMALDFNYKTNDGKFQPITDTKVYKPDFNAPVKGDANREIKISDEAQKQLDKIESQRTALMQNLLTIERQTKELGTQKLLQDEMLQQFEKGGKYELIKDERLKSRLLTLAKEYDIAKATKDVDDARGKAILAFIEQGKELQRQTIERNRQQAESVKLQVEDIENLTRRTEHEREIANLSDTQRQKALEYYDLKTRIVQMGQDPLWTDEQISRIETANQKMIEATDQTRKYENSFSVGFSRAFENFKEQATSSFSAGQSAFQSMTGNMESALQRFVQTGKLSFKDLAASIIQDLISIQIKAQATGLFQDLLGNIGGLFGGFGENGGVSATAGAYSIDANPYIGKYANGGEPPIGRPSLVGERGPELFVPKTAGTIIPNNQLSSAMGGQPQTVYNGPVIQNMNAIDTQSGIQFLTKNKDTIWAANQSAQRALPMSR